MAFYLQASSMKNVNEQSKWDYGYKGRNFSEKGESENRDHWKIFPVICSKFTQIHMLKTVFVQQDNAKPHTDPPGVDLLEEGVKDGWIFRKSANHQLF